MLLTMTGAFQAWSGRRAHVRDATGLRCATCGRCRARLAASRAVVARPPTAVQRFARELPGGRRPDLGLRERQLPGAGRRSPGGLVHVRRRPRYVRQVVRLRHRRGKPELLCDGIAARQGDRVRDVGRRDRRRLEAAPRRRRRRLRRQDDVRREQPTGASRSGRRRRRRSTAFRSAFPISTPTRRRRSTTCPTRRSDDVACARTAAANTPPGFPTTAAPTWSSSARRATRRRTCVFSGYSSYQLDTTWKRFQVLFVDTRQDPGNGGYHTPADRLDVATPDRDGHPDQRRLLDRLGAGARLRNLARRRYFHKVNRAFTWVLSPGRAAGYRAAMTNQTAVRKTGITVVVAASWGSCSRRRTPTPSWAA